VSGRVTDDKGNPIPNVSIIVKGTNTGTTTDQDGSYTLSVPANGRTLVFSSVGMATKEEVIGDRTTLSLSMATGADQNLQEVVVVGYGTQRRGEVTGSVSQINGNRLRDQPVQSFEQGLSGRAAGVNISVPNGVLGNPPVIRVRGINSISLSSFPLVVIDGVPSFSGDIGGTANNNVLGDINPSDIESIEVLKDAAAAAIYGSRAAAGVLLITTRKGRQGRARVGYDGWAGWTKAYNLIPLLNAQQYTDLKNEGLINAGTPPNGVPGPNGTILPPATGTARGFYTMNDANGNLVDTRWYDHIYRTGFAHNHSVNVSGASDKTSYYFSAGMTDQEGMLKNNDFKRLTGRFTLDQKVNDWLSLGGTFSYTNSKNNGIVSGTAGGGFSIAGAGRLPLVLSPNVAPYNNNGTYNINLGANTIGQGNNLSPLSFYNPIPLLDLNRYQSNTDRNIANAYAQFRILRGLTFKTLYGIDNLQAENQEFRNSLHGDGVQFVGAAQNVFQRLQRSNWQNILNYNTTLVDRHNIGVVLGAEQQKTQSSSFGADRRKVADPFFNEFQGSFAEIVPSGNSLGENYLESYFGRINYDLSKKYFFSVNGRRDGYSAFAPGRKWGNFWGVSAGWSLSEEAFFKNSGAGDVINNLRLRASYGQVGNNQGISNFGFYSFFNAGLYGTDQTIFYSQAGNANLTWETSKKTDVGFNMGLLNNRLNVEFAWYKNDIDGLILDDPQAPSRGVPGNSILNNIGSMYNKGIELTLSGNIINSKNFTWSSNFNITTQKNEVTALAAGNADILVATSGLERANIIRVGESIGSFYAVPTEGVNPANGQRIFVLGDGTRVQYNHAAPSASRWTNVSNGSNAARGADQAKDGVIYGPALPKYFGGFDNTVRFKGFDVNVLLYFSGGNYVYNGTKAGLHDNRNWNNAADAMQRWTKPGENAKYPRIVFGDNISNGSGIVISENLEKGDFIKGRNVSVGYTLPTRLMGRTGFNNARVYVAALNAFTITDYSGFDPEIQSNGNSNGAPSVDRNSTPLSRTINVGINIGF
jgi:TonB-linked SusC/RagA family outer membrane protein